MSLVQRATLTNPSTSRVSAVHLHWRELMGTQGVGSRAGLDGSTNRAMGLVVTPLSVVCMVNGLRRWNQFPFESALFVDFLFDHFAALV